MYASLFGVDEVLLPEAGEIRMEFTVIYAHQSNHLVHCLQASCHSNSAGSKWLHFFATVSEGLI